MKKIIIIIFLVISYNSYSQPEWTGNVDTNKIRLSSLIPVTKTDMHKQFTTYHVAIYCDSVLKVSFGDSLFNTGNWTKTTRGIWDYIGKFDSRYTPDLWIRTYASGPASEEAIIRVWGE